MAGKLPQIHEGRDGERQRIKLLNQLQSWVPAPTKSVWSFGPFSLLEGASFQVIPASSGWITSAAYLVPDVIDGVQSGPPEIHIGSNLAYDNIVSNISIGTSLVVDEAYDFVVLVPRISTSDAIFFSVDTPGTGPDTMTATVYLEGNYR